MSERMTSITLPSLQGGAGLAEYGRKTPAEMIAQLRAYADQNKKDAEAILAASDDDFHVATYLGTHSRRAYTILQKGNTE